VPLDRFLLLRSLLLIIAVVATISLEPARRQLQDLINVLEHLPIMAHHQQTPAPLLEQRMERLPGSLIEVVGRLVQDQEVWSGEQPAGQDHSSRLAAAERAERSIQRQALESALLEHRIGAFRDVPVVPDEGLEAAVVAACLEPLKRLEPVGDAQHLRDGLGGMHLKALREVLEPAQPLEVARGGSTTTDEQLEQGGLSHAVRLDESGAERAEHEGEMR